MSQMPAHVQSSIARFCEMSGIDHLEPSINDITSLSVGSDVFNLEYNKDKLFSFYAFEIDPFEIDKIVKHALEMSAPEIHFPLEVRVGLMGERHIVYTTTIEEADVTPTKISFVFETLLAQKEILRTAIQT
jgi:type III secretion system chaperone SycN